MLVVNCFLFAFLKRVSTGVGGGGGGGGGEGVQISVVG